MTSVNRRNLFESIHSDFDKSVRAPENLSNSQTSSRFNMKAFDALVESRLCLVYCIVLH